MGIGNNSNLYQRKRNNWYMSSSSSSLVGSNEDLMEMPVLPSPKRLRRSIKLNEEQQQNIRQQLEPSHRLGEPLEDDNDNDIVFLDSADRNIPWWSRARVWSDSDSIFDTDNESERQQQQQHKQQLDSNSGR